MAARVCGIGERPTGVYRLFLFSIYYEGEKNQWAGEVRRGGTSFDRWVEASERTNDLRTAPSGVEIVGT